MAHHRSLGNDERTQVEVHHGNDGCRDEVGAQQSLETHTAGQHGDNLRVACQFGGEEDNGNEDEQRREEVGEVGHEIGVVVKDDSPQRCVVGGKLGEVLVDVEDDADGDNQDDGIDVGADELVDDIPVHALHLAQYVVLRLPRHCAEYVNPFQYLRQLLLHLLLPRLSITERFHCVKSPCSMC